MNAPFWSSATLFSVGAVAVLLWCWLNLVGTTKRLLVTAAIFGLWFLLWVNVIHPHVEPLTISAFLPARPTDLNGKTFGGITWREYYTQVEVSLFNDSAFDYVDVDFVITSDQEIADVGQYQGAHACWAPTSAMPTVISHTDAARREVSRRIEGNNDETALDIGMVTSSIARRVRCGLIPKHSRLILVLAVSNRTGGDNKPLPRIAPKYVNVEGEYQAALRSTHFKLTRETFGFPKPPPGYSSIESGGGTVH